MTNDPRLYSGFFEINPLMKFVALPAVLEANWVNQKIVYTGKPLYQVHKKIEIDMGHHNHEYLYFCMVQNMRRNHVQNTSVSGLLVVCTSSFSTRLVCSQKKTNAAKPKETQ
jgi:hypothetical protein